MDKKCTNNISSLIFDNQKFITDASLGKLAKWLRLLGYDTLVFPKEAGREMLRLAAAEGRIVLTKRHDMLERQFCGNLFLVVGVDLGSQLNDVISKFSLKINQQKMFGICLKCNERLYPVTPEEVRNLVPPFVFENCTQYNKCPRCQNVYWAGTHQRNAWQFMKQHIPCYLP
jgi:uncharacterized protein with PIN domain